MKLTFNCEHSHPATVLNNVQTTFTVPWPGGSGYVFVQSLTLAGAGTLDVVSAPLNDGLPATFVATGSTFFWSEAGNITFRANVPGAAAGDVATTFVVVTEEP